MKTQIKSDDSQMSINCVKQNFRLKTQIKADLKK